MECRNIGKMGNIKRTGLRVLGYEFKLFREPDFLLREELRDVGNDYARLTAVVAV